MARGGSSDADFSAVDMLFSQLAAETACKHLAACGFDAHAHAHTLNDKTQSIVCGWADDSDYLSWIMRQEQEVSETELRAAWEQILTLEDAMHTLDRDITVWRGTDREHAEQLLADGTHMGFLATSHDKAVAQHFADKHEDPALVAITIKAGHPVLCVPPFLAQDRDEAEVLLDRSSAFIQSGAEQVDPDTGRPIYHLATDGLTLYYVPDGLDAA